MVATSPSTCFVTALRPPSWMLFSGMGTQRGTLNDASTVASHVSSPSATEKRELDARVAELEREVAAAKMKGKPWTNDEDEALRRAVGESRVGGPTGSIDWKLVFEKLQSPRSESTIKARWAVSRRPARARP